MIERGYTSWDMCQANLNILYYIKLIKYNIINEYNMKIVVDAHNNRILHQDNGDLVNINNGSIIQYTGIYYKTINEIVKMVEIRTSFIGSVDWGKTTTDTGVTGIYVKPLYIYDNIRDEWNKLVNFKPRTDISFLYYPHLLLLPDIYSMDFPLYFLQTCKNKCLDDFSNIYKCFSLDS
jgi:hypothetical protein